MEAAKLILALAATWATIGLILYLWDVTKMAMALICMADEKTTRNRAAIVLATIAVEAAITGPLYVLLRSDWFRKGTQDGN